MFLRSTFVIRKILIPLVLIVLISGCASLPEDASLCSATVLIDAINDANESPGSDTITLEPDCTYLLAEINNNIEGANGLPSIQSSITIIGSNSTISRFMAPITPYFRIFHVSSEGNLTLENVRITGGDANIEGGSPPQTLGGGIYNGGYLNLGNTEVSENRAAAGAGIYNKLGDVIIDESSIFGNQASLIGGGIFNVYGSISITNSQIFENVAANLDLGGGRILDHDALGIFRSISPSNITDFVELGGGGIFNLGAVDISNSQIMSNRAGGHGGGVFNQGAITMDQVVISDNQGGGIFSGPSCRGLIENSDIRNNSASIGAGVVNMGWLTISNSSLFGNSSATVAGGIFNVGVLQLMGSTVSENSSDESGGGIFNRYSEILHRGGMFGIDPPSLALDVGPADLTIDSIVDDLIGIVELADSGASHSDSAEEDDPTPESTPSATPEDEATEEIAGTTPSPELVIERGDAVTACAGFGGFPSGVLITRNSTISGNEAATLGGGIMNSEAGHAFVIFSTVADNSASMDGAGVLFDASAAGSMNFDNSIVANNHGPTDCALVALADWRVSGANLSGDGSCLDFTLSTDPALGPLQNNGGPTLTHALLAGSPAIDGALGECLIDDQRGESRPMGSACDVGAFELGGSASEAIESGGTPEVLQFNTPTPGDQPTVIITTDTLCLKGPSSSDYEVVNTLTQGLVGQLIGAGETGQGNDDWLVMSHPNFPETTCWVDSDNALPSVPFSEMRLIFVPPAPTATPKPTREPISPPPSDDGPEPEPTCQPDPNIPHKCD